MGSHGTTSYIDKVVNCPYYRRVDWEKNQIVCEGVDGASSSRMVFETRQELKQFIRERCSTHYCLCVLCRAINEYYEVSDEQGIN